MKKDGNTDEISHDHDNQQKLNNLQTIFDKKTEDNDLYYFLRFKGSLIIGNTLTISEQSLIAGKFEERSKSLVLPSYEDKLNFIANTEPIKEELLNTVIVSEKAINSSFCETFFIASISPKNGKVEEDTEQYDAVCNHKKCKTFCAMKPEIIYKFPDEEVSKLELNSLAASICFPFGIKLCYSNNEPFPTYTDYTSSITNQNGDRFYLVTYHFYLKILNGVFVNEYAMHPIKYNTMKFCNDFIGEIDENDYLKISMAKKLEEYGELNFHEYIYIPHCICLISKYPYFKQMEQCLESIYTAMTNYNTTADELINLITYIVREIPVPPNNSSVKFLLPFTTQNIEIPCPYYDFGLINEKSNILFSIFSIENIITIFRLILLEQKIVFVDDNYERLTAVLTTFISLIYPFQ